MDSRTRPLTDREVDALARAFHTPITARQVLEAAGLPPSRQPIWQDLTAEEFWREVNSRLAAGVLPDGRNQILAAARNVYPANPIFSRNGETPPSDAPGRPSTALPAAEPTSPGRAASETTDPPGRAVRRLSHIAAAALLLTATGTVLVIVLVFARSGNTSEKSISTPTTPPTSTLQTPVPSVSTAPSPSPSTQAPSLRITEKFAAPGRHANGLTSDGRDLWVSGNENMIFRVDVEGNTVASYLAPEPTPEGITWDGDAFWLFATNHSDIIRFHTEGEETRRLGSFNPPPSFIGGGITHDMSWDDGFLWWVEEFDVYRLDTTGKPYSKFTRGKAVSGLEWDDRRLWLASSDPSGGTVIEAADRNGKTMQTFTVPIADLSALAWADGTLWALGGGIVPDQSIGRPDNRVTDERYIYRLDVSAVH